MEYVEHELVNLVKPGVRYPDLLRCAGKNRKLLLDHSICFGSLEGLLYNEIPTFSCLMGLVIFLEIQVHDLGGHLKDVNGTIELPHHTLLFKEYAGNVGEYGFYSRARLLFYP